MSRAALPGAAGAAVPRRRRSGRWLVLAVLLGLGAAEVLLVGQVAQLLGSGGVLAWVLAAAAAGVLLLRRAGRRAARLAAAGPALRQPPQAEVSRLTRTAAVGVLLLVPGFLSDLAALLLLLPGAPRLLGRAGGALLQRALERSLRRSGVDVSPLLRPPASPRGWGAHAGSSASHDVPGDVRGDVPGGASRNVPGGASRNVPGDVVQGEVVDPEPPHR
ncbi:hypothetical protein NUM3379_03000 [Kineococcus sp. NUM-3379]